MFKHLLFLLFLITIMGAVTSYAQSGGDITGKVTMVNGAPFSSASVSITQILKSTLTDQQGNYTLKNVQPGTYHVKIQVLGASEENLEVTVFAGQTAIVNYQFTKENIQALQEVTISGNVNRFSNKESIYIAKLPLKSLENPQVYNTVSKDLIQEQMVIDLGNIGKDIPGAGIATIANQGRVTFHSRGFEVEPNGRNGVAGTAFSVIDPANLERIEALKGPSATLFGNSVSSSYGGFINRVTKKPYNGFGGEVDYYTGSFGLNRLTLDLNTPVNADKTALFRLNGATTYQKSFQDVGFSNTLSLAPSFSYQITDRLSLLLDVEFGQANATSVVRFNPYLGSAAAGYTNATVPQTLFPYNKTFLSNDLPYQTQMVNIFAQINYKISGSWNSQTIISRARSNINGYISALNAKSATTIAPSIIVGNTSFTATDIQQNFIGDFKIGKFRNRVVAGLDYYSNYNDFDRLTVTMPTVNFINTPATYKISKFQVDSLASAKGTLRKETNSDNTYSTYVSDVFNITDRLNVMASLRVDHYQYLGNYNITTGVTGGGAGTSGTQAGPYNQTALSPKLGIVYEVVKDQVSLFGNYLNGFFNHSGSTITGSALIPEHGTQFEAGVKGDVLNHRLAATLSLYTIQVQNAVRQDPASDPTSLVYIQDGTQLSRGAELDITANPFTGFNLVAGYAFNDIKYTAGDPTIVGLRPGLSGPGVTVNFWASYRLPSGDWKGLGAGFGGYYGNNSYQTNTINSKIIIPSYKILDASLFYDQPKYRISFKVDNLTNQKAWNERLTPMAPATFIGSMALKF